MMEWAFGYEQVRQTVCGHVPGSRVLHEMPWKQLFLWQFDGGGLFTLPILKLGRW